MEKMVFEKKREYKPSMFNHYALDPDNDSLILFNSYLGAPKIVSVGKEKKEKVKEWLDNKGDFSKELALDDDFLKLAQMGFFVKESTDEKVLRDDLLTKLQNDTTLRIVIHTSKACNFRCKY